MLREYLSNIANAIRTKLGTTEKVNAQDFAEKVNEVYDKGRNDEWSDEWVKRHTAMTMNWNGKMAFAGCTWTNDTFKPKYSFSPANAEMMFANCGYLNLAEILEERGLTFNFSNCNYFDGFAQTSQVTHFPVIDIRNAQYSNNLFNYSSYCVTIDKLIIKDDGTSNLSNGFYQCRALENIVIEGVIGGHLDMRYSTKLTHDSLMSIINALKDYSESGTVRNLYIGSGNIAKLSEDEKDIIDKKGWTLS